MKEQVQFNVEVKGSVTGKKHGPLSLTAKVRQTYREILRQDEIYRVTVGVDAANATQESATLAGMFAYLKIRLVEVPEWLLKINYGLDAEDPEILPAIFKACVAAINEETSKAIEQAEKDTSVIKEALKTQ